VYFFVKPRVTKLWKIPIVRISFGWENLYIGKALPEYHGFSYLPLLDLENYWPRLRYSINLPGAVCTSKPEQQPPSTISIHQMNIIHHQTPII
jgi:hypothetical protein